MEKIVSKSVKSFISKISPMSTTLNNNSFSEFIFRGQGNSNWALMPSAFRKSAKFPFNGSVCTGPMKTYREQREVEWSMLRDFLLEVNRNGHHLPEEQLLYRLIDRYKNIDELSKITRLETSWPSNDYYSMLALAQHYGLPTRLMDWSYSSLVAAYFAAKGCLTLQKDGKRVKSLSVFALNKRCSLLSSPSMLKDIHLLSEDLNSSSTPIVTYHTVESPTYFNQNLLSQRGIFLCCTEYGNIKNESFEPVSLNEYLKAKLAEETAMMEEDRTYSMLRKLSDVMGGEIGYEFRLSAKYAGELLRELDRLFINSSTMFPGISGCVATMYDRHSSKYL
ncbi:FRG domain-containing protein [Agarivorans sp. 1_MG-2023]|uniref:FRG domain-containing protein n=1 Tax=Agarivorans sp. 1_MG-2023 TaxID=3062634 RepID=UPI0026E4309A|nr:FRG domain-containing protein [Agarivorans sp. 1_MG-2023]MDO6763700.1 FRG domain-containing protein [Agarivorans sp. 1_MG-2023]